MVLCSSNITYLDFENILSKKIFSNGPDSDKFVPTTVAVTIPPPPPELFKTARKSEQACQLIKNIKILGLSYHILNGVGADVGEFPHMSAVGKRICTFKNNFISWLKPTNPIGFSDEVDETNYSFDCGGSMISKVKIEIHNYFRGFLIKLFYFTEFRLNCR